MRALFLFLALAVTCSAQNIVLKDGRVVAAKALQRQGETIVAAVEIPGAEAGQPAKTGEFGYALAQIARLDFPEPTQLRTAPDLVAEGKAVEALAQLEPLVKYYTGFRDAPGSWWVPLTLRKVQAMFSLGREKEAEALAEQVGQLSSDPGSRIAANVQVAASLARRGDCTRALPLIEPAFAEGSRPETLAAAYIVKGQCLLAQKDWENAILTFLQVPVFYPSEKILLPQALLGRGRAHFGMDDLPAAKAALNELIKTYGATAEARAAQADLDKVLRREKALAEPK